MSYDDGGHVLSVLSEADSDGDGVPGQRSTASFTYGSQGELLASLSEQDFAQPPSANIDGIIDVRETAAYEYDARGNLVRQVATAGAPGFPPSTQTTLQQFDSHGNVVSVVVEADFNGNGTVDVRIRTVNSYNSNGQLVLARSESDLDGNGTVDSISVVTTVYAGVKG